MLLEIRTALKRKQSLERKLYRKGAKWVGNRKESERNH